MGARRFITNNSRDFGKSINEIEVTCPADLPDPAEPSGPTRAPSAGTRRR